MSCVNVTKVNWNTRALTDAQRSAAGLFSAPSSVDTPQRAQFLTYSVSMPLKRILVSEDLLLSHSVSLPRQIHA